MTAAFVFIGLVTVLLLVGSGYAYKRDNFVSSAFSMLGVMLLIAFSIFSTEINKDGSPVLEIAAGEYKVGFIYIAGKNVNVALEKKGEGEDKAVYEHIYLYQFNRDAFDGTPNLNAKKLVVVQSGSFKKLRLE